MAFLNNLIKLELNLERQFCLIKVRRIITICNSVFCQLNTKRFVRDNNVIDNRKEAVISMQRQRQFF